MCDVSWSGFEDPNASGKVLFLLKNLSGRPPAEAMVRRRHHSSSCFQLSHELEDDPRAGPCRFTRAFEMIQVEGLIHMVLCYVPMNDSAATHINPKVL